MGENMGEELEKHTCQSCAFLKLEDVTIPGPQRHAFSTSWSREERIRKRPDYADQPERSWCCHKGVWSKASGLKHPLDEVLSEDRKNKCFWYPWDEGTGMFFQAADELEKRRFEFRHLRKTRVIATAAAAVSVVSLFSPFVIRILF